MTDLYASQNRNESEASFGNFRYYTVNGMHRQYLTRHISTISITRLSGVLNSAITATSV